MEMSSYLMHYGIKGMKWGVRNDYEPIGRYRTHNNASSFNRSTPQRSHSRGQNAVSKWGFNSSSNSNFIKKHRKAIQNTLIATAALSAAAIVGVNVYKHGLMRSDRILKSGTLVQNIAKEGRNFNTPFYGVNDVADMKYYAKNFTNKKGRDIATLLTNKDDVRIAGKDAMDRAFKRAYGNHPIKREIFYRRLGGLSPQQKGKFVSELRKAGYGGHKDINDMQFLFGGNTPTVFFGKASGFTPAGSYKVDVNRAKKVRVLTGVGKRTLMESGALGIGSASAYGAYRVGQTNNTKRRKSSNG